jgi:hypothetical protein
MSSKYQKSLECMEKLLNDTSDQQFLADYLSVENSEGMLISEYLSTSSPSGSYHLKIDLNKSPAAAEIRYMNYARHEGISSMYENGVSVTDDNLSALAA